MTGTVLKQGVDLIEKWESALARESDCKRALKRAECDVLNTQSELAKWLLPDDATPGEKFSVWHGNEMIVEVTAPGGDGAARNKAIVKKRNRKS